MIGARATRRFTVDEYQRMGEAGILPEDERVELIEGEILTMAALGGPHVSCVIRLEAGFGRSAPGRFMVSTQNPVRLSSDSAPQPDVAILRVKPDFYAVGLPAPEDVLLLIEVADSSLGFDRGTKLPLYAAASIPDVWIVNLNADCVEVYRQPEGEHYREQRVYRRGETLTPVALPELAFPIASILG